MLRYAGRAAPANARRARASAAMLLRFDWKGALP